MTTTIRPFRPGDEDGACYVCLKTGNHGDDGEPFYRDDPQALGRIFVLPYLKFEPELVLILEDEQGISGYALAAFDSRNFYARYDREMRPEWCARFAEPTGDPATWTAVQSIHYLYHHPEYFCPEPYESYPSHVHIDLLPRSHRQGFGKLMMQQLMDRLRERGSPGAHLGLSALNERAHRFYVSLGYTELVRQIEGELEIIYMGKRTSVLS